MECVHVYYDYYNIHPFNSLGSARFPFIKEFWEKPAQVFSTLLIM